jgi:hypothetical protein
MKIWLIIYLSGVIFSFFKSIQKMMSFENEITILDLIYTFIWSLFSWGFCVVLYIDEITTFADKVEVYLQKLGKVVVWRKGKKFPLLSSDKNNSDRLTYTTIPAGEDK